MKRTATFMILTIFLLCSTITPGCIDKSQEQTPESLLVYCGAGMRKPMDEIGSLFEEEHGVSINYNYAGSNTLLSQMELTRKGDVYMPGATYYFDLAREKGLTDYEQFVAYHVPVIAVLRGNPAGITSLEDLANPNVTAILGDPKAAAIGKLGNKILEKNGIYGDVEKNVIARGATVNELVVYISMRQADASIIWEDLVVNSEQMEIVEIPVEQNIIKIVPIGTLTSSEQNDTAKKFVDFVASPEGKAIFKKHGFTTYPDEKYEGEQQWQI
ncbi:MAG: molybdate ABC transporter substrate-binding protein [Methanosarcinales archaeon]|nr:molybdate ABC transporter substrate-binding protein [Methanosarcinales archaeon]